MSQERAVPTFYVNVCGIQISAFDALLELGIKKDRNRAELTPEDVDCRVFMSPQHLKAMLPLIQKALETYEKDISKHVFTVEEGSPKL